MKAGITRAWRAWCGWLPGASYVWTPSSIHGHIVNPKEASHGNRREEHHHQRTA
jgi:hypothetical protein